MATATTGYTLLADFLPEILQYVHGAPSILVKAHVKAAIIEFSQRTLVLKKDPANICFTEDQAKYTLKYASDRYRAIDIIDMREEDTDNTMERTTQNQLDSVDRSWRYVTGTPTRYLLTEDVNEVLVYPIPDEDGTVDMTIKTVVVPTRDQTEFDELFYQKWLEVIQAGALASLLLIPKSTWYDSQLARKFELDFKRGCNNARKVTVSGTGSFPGAAYPVNFGGIENNASSWAGDIFSWD